MTPAPDLQQLIDTIRQDAGTDDVLDQLGTAASTISDLTSTGDAALGYFVDRARGAGRSWVEISTVLGVSKQAAHKRFAESWTSRPAIEYYTPRTKAVVDAASDVARGLNHSYVGTEHLLLAFFTQPASIGTKVLVAHGITEQAVSAAVTAAVPAGTGSGDELGFTRRASHVLQGAAGEALALGHNYVGTEHLLLAFYRDSAGVATTVLTGLGLDESTAWAAIRAVLENLEKAQ
ncbi:Clp protease N-terminal domain-containing protein [Kribbella sancticallisti]|uniref:Clp protease N-terminal domain-containing protein n=1 Tax=Kribbella sancticallisti TaxID=460087 RepID=A0ABN2E7F3_9ACTN